MIPCFSTRIQLPSTTPTQPLCFHNHITDHKEGSEVKVTPGLTKLKSIRKQHNASYLRMVEHLNSMGMTTKCQKWIIGAIFFQQMSGLHSIKYIQLMYLSKRSNSLSAMYVCMYSIRIQVVSCKGNDICLYWSRQQLKSSSKLKRLLQLKFPLCLCIRGKQISYSFTFPIFFLQLFLLENLSLSPLVILSPSAEDFLKLSADQEQH